MENTTQKLTLDVFTSSPNTFQVTSTLLFGERDLILIDAQFTLQEARRLVEKIKATGKNLTTVYITHGHPDHYWGLTAIRDAFPAAKFITTPDVLGVIRRIQSDKLAYWKPILGDAIPDAPIMPDTIEETSIELEGQALQIMPGQGDVDGSTFVWVPTLKAIIAGDIVYENVNIWVLETDPAGRAQWAATLDRIAELHPETVVGGHAELNAQHAPNSISFTKRYLAAYDAAISESKSADAVMTTIKARFPELNGLDGVLQMAANAAFPTPAQ